MKNMKAFAKYTLVFLAIALMSLCGYMYVAPVVIKGASVLRVRSLNLANAKDYYGILSSWISFFVGFMGLVLGYVYYRHKLNIDSSNAANEKKRKRLDDLISKLIKMSKIV
jgi:glycerol-3-phosphate acyltransferase PlsY